MRSRSRSTEVDRTVGGANAQPLSNLEYVKRDLCWSKRSQLPATLQMLQDFVLCCFANSVSLGSVRVMCASLRIQPMKSDSCLQCSAAVDSLRVTGHSGLRRLLEGIGTRSCAHAEYQTPTPRHQYKVCRSICGRLKHNVTLLHVCSLSICSLLARQT